VKQYEAIVEGDMARETSINVRVTADLRVKLEKLATDDKRSLSGYVLKVLQEHVEQISKRK
jgi:predicted HicB family RNase H-like nuclease